MKNRNLCFIIFPWVIEIMPCPPMPAGVKEGIIKECTVLANPPKASDLKAHLLGSGAIMNQVLAAQKILEENTMCQPMFGGVPSYNELRREALHVERENMLNGKKTKVPYVTQVLQGEKGVFVSASDYMKALGDSNPPMGALALTPYLAPADSDVQRNREALRDFFEVDAKHIVWATLLGLHAQTKLGMRHYPKPKE